MATDPRLRRSVKAYEDFTGHKPTKARAAKLDDRDVAGWQMGPMVGVAYEATRDGKTRQYFHEFGKKARPNLIAREDGRQLYIEGGSYKVTDRGVEDMPKLFLVNPSSRTKAKRKARPMARRRTATRRRATRQVAIFRNPARRRRRTVRTRARRRRTYAANPIRRTIRRRRRGATSVRRMRRNPSARSIGTGVMSLAMPAMGIGAGAVVSEIVMGYLPIPANLKTGIARHITKGVVGVVGGMLIGKVLKQKRLGNYFALGAIAIATHDAIKEAIASRAPHVQFGQYARPLRSQFAGRRGMGYINPAATARLAQYTAPLASQFAGATQAEGANPGGETDYRA